jgi:large subunit ribosomal protein L25
LEKFELNAIVRKSVGNGPGRTLRRIGQIPAVLYGPQTESVLLSVNVKELEQVLKRGKLGQIILDLIIQNGAKISKPAMIKELQTHPVSGKFLHVDFYEIDMQRKIRVMIPVVTKGRCKGVENGGMLQIVQREIEVLCLPGNIPEVIEVDIENLDVGNAIHVEDLPLAEHIEILADTNFTVITVLSPKAEEAAIVEEEAEALAEEGVEEAPEAGEPAAEE